MVLFDRDVKQVLAEQDRMPGCVRQMVAGYDGTMCRSMQDEQALIGRRWFRGYAEERIVARCAEGRI